MLIQRVLRFDKFSGGAIFLELVTMEDIDLHFTVSYRGRNLQLTFPAGSTVGELGEKLVELTGVAPHTIKLMVPKRPPLQPTSAQHSSAKLHQSGISEVMSLFFFPHLVFI